VTARLDNLWLANVIDVDDPENRGRIKVSYAAFGNDLQSDWAPVAAPYAGPDHGLYSMPEVGDMAVLAFLAGNVNQPIVLGFIWTGDGAPPGAQPSEKVWKSREGHSLTLSDTSVDGILIEDKHGNRIRMDKDGILIESATKLTVKAGATALIEASGEATMKGNPIQLNP
jgi:phage baseplate assembly protein V